MCRHVDGKPLVISNSLFGIYIEINVQSNEYNNVWEIRYDVRRKPNKTD